MENVKSLLTIPYQQENFKKFSINFLKEVEMVPLIENKNISSSFKSSIESYTIFGTYKDSDGNEILILSVKVKNNSDAQKAQRQFISYLLENEYINYNAALVAYYDEVRENWKLSFVTIEYEFGKKGVELKFKPAKRFSFLVGKDEPTKTYTQQLNPIYISNEKPTLDVLTDAFSVSKLSKDFYEDYKNKYFELYDYLVSNKAFQNESKTLGFENVEKFATTFCKKTLGQIVFLHFVQKKGWLGVDKTNKWGEGDKKYLIHSIEKFSDGNYFNDFLEPLFYTALNIKRENDLYLDVKIPFLNGGLFHPIQDYRWETTDFNIPDSYWYNKDETGLLNILSQYNFTVDEADPEEQEMAVDPEMLGKIFESLLDTEDRSSLGAFYTPREIVHFMCEEAIAARLSKILDLDYDSILNYVRYGDALKEDEFIHAFAEEIDEYLSKFTIIDPAVGSGAFLVGMLNQIVKLRTNLLQYTNKNIDKYQMKLEAIQNCLYGVDIEYDAVEIAKLRLWLSLIVDQETDGKTPKPLPNLNFHLRVGNSLVDTFDGIKLWSTKWRGTKKTAKVNNQLNLFNTDTISAIMARLKDAKVKFFSTSDDEEKQKLLRRIEQEQIELIRSELVAKGKFDLFIKIEEMINKKTKPFFIWELEFEEVFENDGFDIVIANPPYVQLQKDGGKLADELKDQGYETFVRMGDIYCIFYEKAIDLMKKNGVFCYITSNKWMRAGYGEKLRGFLANNSNPLKLIDFGGNKIFESATVDVNILLGTKEQNKHKTCAVTIGDDCTKNLSDYIIQNSIEMVFDNSNNWVLLNAVENSIQRKIESNGIKLENWDIKINYGIKTGYNEAFIIDEATKNTLIESDPKSAEIIRPILRGKDIKKYLYEFKNVYLICTFPSRKININDYPAIKSYLLSFGIERLEQSGNKNINGIKGLNARKKTGNKWFETQDQINYWDDFFEQNIAWQRITHENTFCLTTKDMVILDSMAFINGAKDKTNYLLAVLNSSLIKFWIKKNVPEYGSSGYRLSNQFVTQIPIPINIDKNLLDELETLVQGCLEGKDYKRKIDLIVNNIYGLSKGESDYIINEEYNTQ